MLITIELITDEVLSDELHVGRGAFDVYLAPLNKHHYYFLYYYSRLHGVACTQQRDQSTLSSWA